jgi:hypothetical protein
MATAYDIRETLDDFERCIESIKRAYPRSVLSTPDRSLEKYVSAFRHARACSDHEGIRRESGNICNFFDDYLPSGTIRIDFMNRLSSFRKSIASLFE